MIFFQPRVKNHGNEKTNKNTTLTKIYCDLIYVRLVNGQEREAPNVPPNIFRNDRGSLLMFAQPPTKNLPKTTRTLSPGVPSTVHLWSY
jgi:hypothetical protein